MVVEAGISAVQIVIKLAEVANVTIATRSPIRFVRQAPLGIDLHYWARAMQQDLPDPKPGTIPWQHLGDLDELRQQLSAAFSE